MGEHAITRDTLLNLMEERRKIESSILSFNEILQQNGVGLEGPLVDAEGYPRNDIDVYQVRVARNKIICLKNDLKALMKTIEDNLYTLHKQEGTQELPQVNVDSSPMNPILKVGSVSFGSPADIAGLKTGDLIVQIGTINCNNFSSLADVARVVQHSVNGSVDFKVQRQGRGVVSLQVHPRPWSGQGNLGCVLLPMESIER